MLKTRFDSVFLELREVLLIIKLNFSGNKTAAMKFHLLAFPLNHQKKLREMFNFTKANKKSLTSPTYLRSWFICPLQMVFSGTVLYVPGLANSTIFSATNSPKPNFLLTCSPTPFGLQSWSCFRGSQFEVHTTTCCTSRHVRRGL